MHNHVHLMRIVHVLQTYNAWYLHECLHLVLILSCMEPTILCSVLNWRAPLHYTFIRQENNRANLLLQVCITHIIMRV